MLQPAVDKARLGGFRRGSGSRADKVVSVLPPAAHSRLLMTTSSSILFCF